MHVNLQRETTVFMLQNCLAWTQVLICGWPFSAAISATPLSLSQLVSCGGGGAAGGPTEGGGGVTPSFSSPMPLPSSLMTPKLPSGVTTTYSAAELYCGLVKLTSPTAASPADVGTHPDTSMPHSVPSLKQVSSSETESMAADAGA